MTKLTKTHIKARDELVSRIQDDKVTLEQAVELYNSAVNVAWLEVQSAIDAYNGRIGDINSYRDEISGEIKDYISDKSEAWQGGDKGSAYEAWADQWGEQYEEVSLDKPNDLEVELEDIGEELGQLPEQPE